MQSIVVHFCPLKRAAWLQELQALCQYRARVAILNDINEGTNMDQICETVLVQQNVIHYKGGGIKWRHLHHLESSKGVIIDTRSMRLQCRFSKDARKIIGDLSVKSAMDSIFNNRGAFI